MALQGAKIEVNEASIIYQARTVLSELATDIADARKIKSPETSVLILKATKIKIFLKALDYAEFMTREEREKIWYALIEVSGIYDFPTAPLLETASRPDILLGYTVTNNITGLQTLDNGKIFVGNASNVPVGVTMSGDVTISNTGVAAISSGVIVNADINASAAIATDKLAALTPSQVVRTNAQGKLTTIATDTTPTNGSTNLIDSNAVFDGLAAKANTSHTHAQSDITGLVAALAAKENSLGYTPENVANKENTTINSNTTKYPTVNLLSTGLATKQPLDATLTALAGLATGANKIPRSTGTDTFDQLDFVDEDNMVSNSASALPSQQSVKAYVDLFRYDTIQFIIDGGGSAIGTGIKGDIEIPFGCTITKATALADQSGSIVVDIWKDTYANFAPTDADSITAAAPVTISAATKSQDSTLTGWTTALTRGDILRYNVDSASTVTRVTISLQVTKTA